MERLVSIQEVEKKFDTAGSRPLLVHASDLEFYVTKYPFFADDTKLLNEYLAYHFAKIWELPIPEMKLIILKREHLPEYMLGMQLSYISIEKPLIGSLHNKDVTELVDKFTEKYSAKVLSRFDKKLLLQIALFDIWLSNEDRNTGNMNLLVNLKSNVLTPILIDNEKIFNSGNPFKPLNEITYEDSLFYTLLFHKLGMVRNQSNVELLHDIEASLQSFCTLCVNQLHQIVKDIPDEWGFNKDLLHESLASHLFSERWINKVRITFLKFASLMTQKP